MTTLANVHIARTAADDPAVGQPVDIVFGETIEAVTPAGSAATRGDVVDGAGRFVLPGLIDTHAHLAGRDALLAAARAGVTTLVDLGTYPDSRIAQQRAERGVAAIVSAGMAASAPGSNQIALMGFPDESGVTGPEDAERFLDWRVESGSELIKIIIEDPAATQVPALTVDTVTALVRGAHRRGLLTVAHVVTAAAFERGLDAGVDILTHSPLDRPLPAETVERMLAAGTIASPTLVMMRTMARARLGDRADAAFANSVESVRRMHATGVPIVVGTDANDGPMAAVAHGSSLHVEIGLLQVAGLGAAEVLRAATGGAAAAFRLTDRGSVEPELRADLVLVSGDPVTDPALAATPDAVWVAGSLVT